ncbi:MAG: hypothetical protein AAGE96_25120 [Cyanobacteria bacterium P01_G01_bin.19]
MDRGKAIAVFTGAISILIAIAYLVIVQLLDFRGEMIPAPINQLPSSDVHVLLTHEHL